MPELQKNTEKTEFKPLEEQLEETNFSKLSIKSLEDPVKSIYDRFKEVREEILKHGKLEPYIGHQYSFMVKAFSLFVDYYNQYCYSLPRAIEKFNNEINDYPEDDAK